MINTKTKGELGRRIEYDVEHDLFHPQNVYSDEYITPTFVEYVKQLEAQIEKMKCCYNCSKDCGSIDRRICFENKMKDWELKKMTKDELEKEAEEIANKRCHEIMCYGHCSFNSPKHHRCGAWHREYNCAKNGIEYGLKSQEKRIAELEKSNTSLLSSVENLNKSVQELEKENAELILGNKSLSAKLMNTTREKLDLQKENAELKLKLEALDGQTPWKDIKDKSDLIKENAELKEKLNIRSCQNCRCNNKSCPNDGSCKHYSKWEGYENPQLTKAKELLTRFVMASVYFNGKEKDLVEEAEQFLNSEVEK